MSSEQYVNPSLSANEVEQILCHPLTIMLEFAVPMEIDRLQMQGGPLERDWNQAREFGDVLGLGPKQNIDDKGEHVSFVAHPLYGKADAADLIYKSRRKGASAAMFAGMARAIAVLAFAPGGIRIFCRHWLAVIADEESEEQPGCEK